MNYQLSMVYTNDMVRAIYSSQPATLAVLAVFDNRDKAIKAAQEMYCVVPSYNWGAYNCYVEPTCDNVSLHSISFIEDLHEFYKDTHKICALDTFAFTPFHDWLWNELAVDQPLSAKAIADNLMSKLFTH